MIVMALHGVDGDAQPGYRKTSSSYKGGKREENGSLSVEIKVHPHHEVPQVKHASSSIIDYSCEECTSTVLAL
jgi:hypothetical protein